jgi:hypothetical protein
LSRKTRKKCPQIGDFLLSLTTLTAMFPRQANGLQAAVPTLLFKDGFSVKMYFNDHPPPHVHVILGSSEARIELGTISMTHVYGMKKKSAVKAQQLVRENRGLLLQKWVEMHGPTII